MHIAFPTLAKQARARGLQLLSLLCFKLKRHDLCIALAKKSYSLTADEATALLLSDALKHSGLLQQAEDACQQHLATCPTSVKAAFKLCTLLLKQRKWWQAKEALTLGLRLEPNRPKRWLQLGNTLEKLRHYAEAAAAYKSALVWNDDALEVGSLVDVYYSIGFCLEKAQAQHQALNLESAEFYAKALNLEIAASREPKGLIAYHIRRDRLKSAAQVCQRELLSRPQDTTLHYTLGTLYERNHEWKDAETCYREALSLAPANSMWHFRLGCVLERQEKYLEASIEYQLAQSNLSLQKSTLPWLSYRLGLVLTRAGQYGQAVRAFASCNTEGAQMRWAENLSNTSLQEGLGANPEPIARKLQRDRILGTDPTEAADAESWFSLGQSLEHIGHHDEAAAAYAQAVSRASKHRHDWYYALGRSYALSNFYREACDAFAEMQRIQSTPLPDMELKQWTASPSPRQAYAEYLSRLPVQSDAILYESFAGRAVSCNPYAIYLHLLSDPAFRSWTHIWAVDDPNAIPSEHKQQPHTRFVHRESDAYVRALATSKFLINNSTFPSYFVRRKNQLYLNTWHGTPWKHMGRDIKYDPYEFGNTSRNFLQATHLLSPNEHTTKVLLDSYNVRPFFSGQFVEAGYPRIDLTLNASASKKERLKRLLGLHPNKPVILYAPTWRGTLASVTNQGRELNQTLKALGAVDAHILFRGHYYNKQAARRLPRHICVPPNQIATNELLAIVDLLITDHSSVGFDFMATGRPIVYFFPDMKTEAEFRGLYFSASLMPGDFCSTSEELLHRVREVIQSPVPHRHYEQCRRFFTPNEDGQATRKIVNWFFHAKNDGLKSVPFRGAPPLLIYGGRFDPNGITTSLLNLLSHLPPDAASPLLLFSPTEVNSTSSNRELFNRVPPRIALAPRIGRIILDADEQYAHSQVNKPSDEISSPLWDKYATSLRREHRRLFGDTRFSASIQFSGYSLFWTALQAVSPASSVSTKSVFCHNDMQQENTSKYPRLSEVFSFFSKYDRIASVSLEVGARNLEFLSGHFGISKDRFVIARNVQNPSEVAKSANAPVSTEDAAFFQDCGPVFMSIGRLSKEKNHIMLIRAFKHVLMRIPAAKLLIIGTGPCQTSLIGEVHNLQLAHCVHLLGHRPNPMPLLKRANCFVLPSLYEGQPMVLYEALALQKPIIATDIPGSRAVLNGGHGHLVDICESALASAMQAYAEHGLLTKPFDFQSYQKEAASDFLDKVCRLKAADA
jgi:CDP-glycerol glycerophosphotransferase